MSIHLEISGLHVVVGRGEQAAHVLRGVDLALPRGQVTGLVGETGSGKSMTVLAATGLLPREARITGGSIKMEGIDLTAAGPGDWRRVRGQKIAMVFQNARQALHPMYNVEQQLTRVYRRHFGGTRREAAAIVHESLRATGFPDPKRISSRYPHELSGGQCQRVMIAAALLCRPSVLLADEPTSGLDVTVQKQVLETLLARVREAGVTMLIVTHDFSVVEHACDAVAVMYAGQVVEFGSREQILKHAAHPYTRGLLACLGAGEGPMAYIAGTVPDLRQAVAGCPFANRCSAARPRCWEEPPPNVVVEPGHTARCILAGDQA